MTNRCAWIDVSRGIAISLVVLGHSIQYYIDPGSFNNNIAFTLIYSFHMPLFFIISGYVAFFSSQNGGGILSKFKRLFIPYISWAFVHYAFSLIILDASLGSLINYVYTPCAGGLWYLWALFFIFCIHHFEDRIETSFVRYLAMTITYIALLFVSNSIDGKFGLYEISKYFLYYAIGFELNRLKIDFQNEDIGLSVFKSAISVVIFCCFFCVQYCLLLSSVWLVDFVIAVSGSLMVLFFSIIISNKSYNILKIFQQVGKQTLIIYALNGYMLVLASVMFNSKWIAIILIPGIIITSCLIEKYFFSKSKMLSMLFLGKLYSDR